MTKKDFDKLVKDYFLLINEWNKSEEDFFNRATELKKVINRFLKIEAKDGRNDFWSI